MALQVALPNSAQNAHFDCIPAVFLASGVAEQELQHHIALLNVDALIVQNIVWPSNLQFWVCFDISRHAIGFEWDYS